MSDPPGTPPGNPLSGIPREALDVLAAELVLGSLPDDERDTAIALMRRDQSFALLVAEWQRRLAPLAEAVPEEPPSPELLRRIETAIDAGATTATVADREPAKQTRRGSPLDALRRRLLLWRAAAIGFAAAAAVLALMVWQPGLFFERPPQRFVAVLGEGEQQPRFLVTVDLEAERVTVAAVGGLADHDGAFELWLVSEDAEQPRSLGLLPSDGRERLSLRGLSAPALLQDGVLAVTLEPRGGSPTGLPTGPVVYSGPLLVQSD